MVEQVDFLGAGEQLRLIGRGPARRDNSRLGGEIGLEAAIGAAPEGGADVAGPRRNERRQPIFVRKAEPAASAGEALIAFLGDLLIAPVVIGGAVEHADHADMHGPAVGVLRRFGAADEGVGARGHGTGAGVGDGLPGGEHIAVVDRKVDVEALALAIVPAQGDGASRREPRAVRRPDGVRAGKAHALAGPAEAREIGLRRSGRRKQADERRIGGEALPIVGEDEVVDAGAAQVDRAFEAGSLDGDARRFGQHDAAVADGGRRIGGGVLVRLRDRHLLSFDDAGGRLAGGGEIAVGNEAPAQKHDRRKDDRQDHVAVVAHLFPLTVLGHGRIPPRGGIGTGAGRLSSRRAAPHSVQWR